MMMDMRRVRVTWILGGLLALLSSLYGFDAAAQGQGQAAVSDCNGQSDGTPCNGNNGVVNLCILAGATCQNSLCTGPRLSCPDLQACAPNTGDCITPLRERTRLRR